MRMTKDNFESALYIAIDALKDDRKHAPDNWMSGREQMLRETLAASQKGGAHSPSNHDHKESNP